LSIIIILKIISLQKKFVLKTKILSSNLFVKSLIDNLVINYLTKFVLTRLYIFYINLSICKKFAKIR